MPENLPAHGSVEGQKEEKKKSKKIWLLIALAFIIIISAGAAVYLFLPPSNIGTKESTSPAGPGEAATPSAASSEEAYSCTGQVYENEDQGYKVCVGEGWVHREFGTSATTVGFDPANIPEASEYAGLIVVGVSGDDIASTISEIEGLLEGSSTTTTTVGSAAATQISGTEPANMVNEGGATIKTLFTHFDRLYVVTLVHNTAENKVSYDAFLSSWRFLDSATAPAPE